MILLKIWWSLIVKKNTHEEINKEYLQQIYNFLQQYNKDTIIITHWTWNVWHGFVQEFGLTKNNQSQLRELLDIYFTAIDTYFPGYKRFCAENVIEGKCRIQKGDKIICGWDISTQAKIISSDDVFSYILHHEDIEDAFLLTDVQWVYDPNKKIIQDISQETLHTIPFWKKEWDVTWAMQQKIEKLFDHQSSKKTVRILHGEDIKNAKNVIETGEWIWTKIHI